MSVLQVTSDDGEAEKVLLLKMAGGFKLGKMLSMQGCGFMDLVTRSKIAVVGDGGIKREQGVEN